MAERHGTEVSFRLGPGSVPRARALARELAEAAEGCLRHVLFVDAERGEYGCLAEWPDRDGAEEYARRAEGLPVLARLGAELGRPPRVRIYAMEEQVSAA